MAVEIPLIPPSRRRFPVWSRLLPIPFVAGLVLVGVWAFGGEVTDNFALAMVLTTLWFGAAGLASLLVGLRWRPLALPVIATFLVVATAIGGYLAWTTLRDQVVNEQVVVGTPASQTDQGSAGGATQITAGMFESRAHGTSGVAAVVELPMGGRVLTLTEFETDPGPDLRVYLVPGAGEDISGFVDLGGLKGNRGNQQYEIPPDADPAQLGSVVIWCRAFSVAFGQAPLAPA